MNGWRQRSLAGVGRSLRSLATYSSRVSWGSVAAVVLGLALAVAVRGSLLDFKSDDYFASLKPWYNTISSQGFAAFGTNFSTYNPPYLYLLYPIARFFPSVPTVVAVKLPGLISDFVCGLFVYLIVGLKAGRQRWLPFAAAMVVLLAPSVMLNAAFWGQADSIFTAGILGWVYFLMRRRSILAMICFGLGLAFKLQAIFLAPIILALALRRILSWKSLLAVPVILFLAILPSWIAGRPLADLVNIYLYQASQFEFITMNAASAYAWLPGTKQVFNLFYIPGVLTGLAAAYVLFVIAYKAPGDHSKLLILDLALAATLVIPFFLPKMHERYFFPADILSIVVAFFAPELFFIPILVAGASFLSYAPFLFQTEIIPLGLLSAAQLVAIAGLTYHLGRLIFSPNAAPAAAEPEASAMVAAPTGPADIPQEVS